MKNNKRRKSEMSDNDSEENGVAYPTTDENDEMKKGKESESEEAPRRTMSRKRSLRGRLSLKGASEDLTENTEIEQEEENTKNAGKGGAGKRLKKEDQKALATSKDKESNQKEFEVRIALYLISLIKREYFVYRYRRKCHNHTELNDV